MGGTQIKALSIDDVRCPKCPLTPIISIFLNPEGILTCEYRCPFMHFGTMPFDDISLDRERKHGKHCDRCLSKNENEDEDEDNEINVKNAKNKKNKTNVIKEELLYCGTCKQFICSKCKPKHDEEKESHKVLIEKSKISYTCLEHGEKYDSYCFTCLKSICQKCKRHEKHCKKTFEEFYPDKEFYDNYKFYIEDYDNYLKSFKKQHGMNKQQFANFQRRSGILLSLSKFLYENFERKKKVNQLNGETIINLLNVVYFDYRVESLETNEKFVDYCKTHLILSNRPISDICTFSKTKSDYKISKFDMEQYKTFDSMQNEKPQYFKYSPICKHIIFNVGSSLHFLGTESKDDNKENLGFKIRLAQNIFSFNILNQDILCVVSDNVYLYKLLKKEPYYEDYKELPVLDIFSDPVRQVMGNIEKKLIVRTIRELIVVTKDKDNFEMTARMPLADVNKDITEVKEVPDTSYHYYSYYGNNNRTKKINITKTVITTIKSIWQDNLVSIESGVVTIRDANSLKKKSSLSAFKNIDCLVFNGNVLIPSEKSILFYTIPNLEKVSCMNVADTIVSINLVNRKTFIVLQSKYMEQFEANTWKRISRQIAFGEMINNNNLKVIGAGKKLFLFNKENNTFYLGVEKKEEITKNK